MQVLPHILGYAGWGWTQVKVIIKDPGSFHLSALPSWVSACSSDLEEDGCLGTMAQWRIQRSDS